MAFKFDWEESKQPQPVKQTQPTGGFQFEWERGGPEVTPTVAAPVSEHEPTPYSPEEQFGRILGTVKGKPPPIKPERPFMEEHPTLYGIGKAIETLPRGIEQLGEEIVSGATLGLSEQAAKLGEYLSQKITGRPVPKKEDVLPEWMKTAGEFAGAAIPIGTAGKVIAEPIIKAVSKSRYLEPFARMIGWGVAGTAYETADKMAREGELPSPAEMARSGGLWAGIEGILGATGWAGRFAIGVNKLAKTWGMPRQEVAKTIIAEAKARNMPIARYAYAKAGVQKALADKVPQAAEELVATVERLHEPFEKTGTYQDLVNQIKDQELSSKIQTFKEYAGKGIELGKEETAPQKVITKELSREAKKVEEAFGKPGFLRTAEDRLALKKPVEVPIPERPGITVEPGLRARPPIPKEEIPPVSQPPIPPKPVEPPPVKELWQKTKKEATVVSPNGSTTYSTTHAQAIKKAINAGLYEEAVRKGEISVEKAKEITDIVQPGFFTKGNTSLSPIKNITKEYSNPAYIVEERIGKCYKLAGEETIKKGGVYVIGEANGVKHAWVERDGAIYDPIYDLWFDKGQYYSKTKAKEIKRMSGNEVKEFGRSKGLWPSPETIPALQKPTHPPVSAAKEPWEMTKEEYSTKAKGLNGELRNVSEQRAYQRSAIHKREVVKALSEGKTVPKAVLADYPELAEETLAEAKVIPKTKEIAKAFEEAPNLSIDRIEAKKRPDGQWQLFYRGTRNEVFPGEEFSSIAEAKNYFKVEKIRAIQKISKDITLGFGPVSELQKLYESTVNRIKSKQTITELPTKELLPKGATKEQVGLSQKFINILPDLKKLRSKQEALYTQERGARFAKAQAAGKEAGGGVKGYITELGQLKGEMPKAIFEDLKGKFTQDDFDNLFKMVDQSPDIAWLQKLNVRKSLMDLFESGKPPIDSTIPLLEKVFGTKMTKALIDQRGLWWKLKNAGLEIANIPRSVMASFDLSFGGRQGIFMAPRYRKEFWKSWKAQFKEFGSERAYKASMDALSQHPNFELASNSGISFTDVGKILTEREERFASSWAEVIPGVRASSRAYTAFANKFRMDIFDSMVKDAEKQGLNPRKNMELLKGIAELVNNGTGRGSLGGFEKAALALNTFFFSPRLMASRLRLLNPVYYIRQKPFVRKEALKSLLTFAGTTMTVLTLAKLVGAEVETDPRNSDFAKIKIGNTRIDILGGFQQYIKIAAQLISGKIISSTSGKVYTLGEGYKPLTRLDILGRSLEYKESPIFSFSTAMLRGTTALGEKFELGKEVGKRFVPMTAQDFYDLYIEDPNLLPLAPLGAFGFGLQSYGPERKGLIKAGRRERPRIELGERKKIERIRR